MKNILFRADSSSSIGTGHIMRDLVLANQYKQNNTKIYFATQKLKGNINKAIEKHNFMVKHLENNYISTLISLIKELKIDLLVIDHYDIKYSDEKKIKDSTGVKILVMDDTYEKHYCDILLNHNISANSKKYINLVPKTCTIRCGSKYTLLRDEFYKEKKRKKYYQENIVKTIFIAMGGADSTNVNIKILKVINKLKKYKVHIVTTTANQHIEKLKRYCKNKKNIFLHINSNTIAQLMAKSDIAIVTPSVVLNEVYFMKLPFIAIKTASNQDDIYKFLKTKRHLTMVKFDKNKLQKYIKELT